MHTWLDQFQRHANAFIKYRMTRPKKTKAEIAKIAVKALDRDNGEAIWAYDPKTLVCAHKCRPPD
jgi:hypothetical protein